MTSSVDHTRCPPVRPKTRSAAERPEQTSTAVLPWIGALLVAAVLSVPAAGAAQAEDDSAPGSSTTDRVLWLFHDDSISSDQRRAFRSALRETLGDSDRKHLVTAKEFETHVRERSAPVPPCLKGTESCISPQALVFDQLNLHAVVRARLRTVEEGLEVQYRLVGRRGATRERATLTGEDPEQLAFSLVRDLFDATGTVAVRSTPSGASVRIDGKSMGTTPLETRLPVGAHSFRLEHGNRQSVEGDFELSSDGSVTVDRELPQKPGRLLVQNAPDAAVVLVDGERRGKAGEAIELDPGTYDVTVRADGYSPHEERLEVGAGETVERSVPLEEESPLLRNIASDAIAVNHYVARLTFDQSIHATSFRDARGSTENSNFEFEGFTGETSSPEEVVRHTLAPRGLRLDLGYTGRHFGVVGMSVSYAATRADRRATFETSDDGERIGTVTSLRRLQLRPLQLTYRRFFKNFVPSIEIGTGIAFQWLSVEGLRPEEAPPVVFHQTEAFWNMGLAGQYFFNPNWFAVLRYSFQDYFNAGRGVEHVISLGAGAAYPDIFGFAPEPPEEL